MSHDIEELKKTVETRINNENESVSEIFFSCIQPFFNAGGDLNEFVTSLEFLQQLPPSIIKLRRFLLQILVLFEIFRSKNQKDPLPDESIKQVLLLIQLISPLALSISINILNGVFEEIQAVHGKCYPQTINELMKKIGIAPNDPSFSETTQTVRRIHYEDGDAILTGLESQPEKTLLNNHPLFRGNATNKNIQKPKHGPNSASKPL